MRKPAGHYHTLTLGEIYLVVTDYYGRSVFRRCKFIKVTRKGFNLLNTRNSKTILNKAAYAKGFGGKEIPTKQKTFKVWLPEWLSLRQTPGQKEVAKAHEADNSRRS
jgi:hypothetical protein